MKSKSFLATVIVFTSLTACQSNSEAPLSDNTDTTQAQATETQPSPQVNCSAPPQVPDIWKLEPMLTEKGLLNASMSEEEKERLIREYIAKKNAEFKNCSKRLKP